MSSAAATMAVRAPSRVSSGGGGGAATGRFGERGGGPSCSSTTPRHFRRLQRRRPAAARSILDAEGIPWTNDAAEFNAKNKAAKDLSARDVSAKAPPGLNMNTDSLPGDSLSALADKLNAAVVQSFKDGLYDECVVDMSPFGIEECYGDVANGVAEVVVSANAAETAGRFNMALRRKELSKSIAGLEAASAELRCM